MTGAILRLIVGMLLCGPLLSSHAQRPNDDIYGTWKITRVVGTADSYGLSARQIRAMIGKPVIVSDAKFAFNGRTCLNPHYTRSVEETSTYFRREWQANSADFRLPNPVTVVATGCNFLYPSGKNRVVVAEESGVFFEAVRVK